MKDKKNIVILILVIAIILIVGYLIYYEHMKYDVTFSLNGESNLNIEYGSKFVDPGFIAQNGYKEDISSNVIVTGNVNTKLPGNYELVYELNYYDVKQELRRNVNVLKMDISKLDIVLNGDETIYVLKDSSYDDKGAYVINSINGDTFELGVLDIKNNVNPQKVGVYTVDYTYTYDDKSISKSRNVEVFDIKYNVNPSILTTGSVKINIDLDTISNYSNTKLPDGKTSLFKQIDYEVSSNGDYLFTITLKNGNKYEKTISIDNIVANYKCTGSITNSGTKITVTPTTGDIKNYEWLIKNKTTVGTNTYNEYKIVDNAKVNIVFNNGKKYQVNCSVEDKLLYRFKYDLKNTGTWTKPEMKCNSYTAAQRTKYEKMLKEAINEAGGKGTRGGVVAAARFLIGGLDYRVIYQSPKTTDSRVGKYAKEGLNIGNSNAWGCRVGGYIQGMDCTHFIEWVLYQNGIKTRPYSFPRSDTSKVIDKLKPGDLVYIKCGKTCANPSAGLSHVGIIIGIDGDTYYIAESVPGKDGKLGVTMHATSRTTLLKAYTVIGNIPFNGEGNLNNMWLTE